MAEDRHDSAPTNDQSPTPVRYAVYIRVNVGAARDPQRVREQREAVTAFLDSRVGDHWTCVGSYEDIGYSAGKIDRPGFQRLLKDVDAGKLDCVIVRTVDRLVRREEDFAMLAGLLRQRKVSVIAVCGEPYVVEFDLWDVESTGRAVTHEPYDRQCSQGRLAGSTTEQHDRIRQ
jgi:hypothetical protein